MHEEWKLQDAKNRFSELVNRAVMDGPQVVTRRGVKTVIVISLEDYRRLASRDTKLTEFLRTSPVDGEDLDLERSRDPGREVEL